MFLGIGYYILFLVLVVDYEYVFFLILLCLDGYDWY